MFDFIRSHQRLMQFLLLVFIVPSFALIGVSGYNTYVSGDEDLVKVGRSAITQQEFDRARDNQLRQIQQNNAGGFDPAMFDTPEMRRAVLESLIDSRVLSSLAAQERFNVSDVYLRRSIADMPQLQVEGQFSPERYNEVLAASGLTPRDFEQGRRYELAVGRVIDPIGRSAIVPAAVLGNLESALLDERVVRLSRFSDQQYLGEVEVTADDIQAWYQENKSTFEVPETVSLDYIVLDEAAAMAGLPTVDDAQLEEYYRQNKARFTRPARVKLSHIQVNVAAGATQEQRDTALARMETLEAQVHEGKDSFADIAKAHSEDAGTARSGGELGWITQGSWPASLDKAVFSLKTGEVSGIIDGPGGYHIFMAQQIEPEQVQGFADVREQVGEEVRRQLGAERFADMATRLTSLLYDQPESLEPAARELDVAIRSVTGVGRNGLVPAILLGADGLAASESDDLRLLDDLRVRRAAFSTQVLAERHNSGVIEISPDTMLAIHVRDLHPAHIPELERVSGLIESQLGEEHAHKMAVKAGQAHLAALQEQGGDTGALSEGFDEAIVVSRLNPNGVSKATLDAALAMGPSQVPGYSGVETTDGFVVLRVEKAQAGEADAQLMQALPQELASLWGSAEEKAVLQAMRVQTGVSVLPDAEQAIQQSDRTD